MTIVQHLKDTYGLRLFALAKIPLIAILRPTVVASDHERCCVRLPLNWLSKNHLGSLYFGALCIGADMAGGLIAMNLIRERRSSVQFIFKDFSARFLKRAEGDTLFTSTDGALLVALLDRAEKSGERVEEKVRVVATVPDKLGDKPVAEFELTISLKKRD